MKKELTCIVCPIGCCLEVTLDADGGVGLIEGHTCPRGEAYARTELTHPVRMLTSTVILKGGLNQRLPVITSKEIPKEKLFSVMEEINKIEVCTPIRMNDIIIEYVCGLDANIIASRSVERIESSNKTENNTGDF